MYAKDRTHWGKFGDFNGMHMKFHTYLPIKGTLADNLYEISNTLQNLLTLARYYIRKTEYNRPALKLCDGSYLTVGSS
ncbi:hypothetical protein D3C74_218950 [compost metagenome]